MKQPKDKHTIVSQIILLGRAIKEGLDLMAWNYHLNSRPKRWKRKRSRGYEITAPIGFALVPINMRK